MPPHLDLQAQVTPFDLLNNHSKNFHVQTHTVRHLRLDYVNAPDPASSSSRSLQFITFAKAWLLYCLSHLKYFTRLNLPTDG
ncbi:hypothetical protein SprV_0802622100 [Sparganum proliferum]